MHGSPTLALTAGIHIGFLKFDLRIPPPSGPVTTNPLDVGGYYDGSGMESVVAEVTIDSSGNALVNVTGELDATINGSGNIDPR
ncbi:hypothetical protein BH23ACT5_BH23ACT5_06230 [soil metagenome]